MNQRSSDARVRGDLAPDGAPRAEPGAGTQPLRAVVSAKAPDAAAARPKDQETLERRIARLERQNRWLKLSILVLFVAGGLFVGNAVLPPDTIVRQTLMESKELKLIDRDGTPRLFLRMYSRVPMIQLLDKSGKPRMSLGLRYNDTPFLDLSDERGRRRASIELDEQGAPLIQLFDEQGRSTTQFR